MSTARNKDFKDHDTVNNNQQGLPPALQRVVISYLLTPENILDEISKCEKALGNATMGPFRERIKTRIMPLFSHSLFSDVYKKKPTLKSNYEPDKLFDTIITKIKYYPIKIQLDFLHAVHEEKWYLEEKDNVLKQTMNEIKESFPSDMSLGIGYVGDHIWKYKFADLKKHIEQIVYDKLKNYIYESLVNGMHTISEENDASNHKIDNSLDIIERNLKQHEVVKSRNENYKYFLDRMPYLFFILGIIFVNPFTSKSFTSELFTSNINNFEDTLDFIKMLYVFIGGIVLINLRRSSENTRFLSTARNHLLAMRSDGNTSDDKKSDDNSVSSESKNEDGKDKRHVEFKRI